MIAESKAQTQGRAPAVAYRSLALRRADQRRFYVLLACAALVHASLIAGFVRSAPRTMGEQSGQPDGISVMIVDAADLESKSTVPLDSAPPGMTSSVAPPSSTRPQSEPPPPSEAPEPSKSKPEPKAEPKTEPKPKEAAVRAIEQEKPSSLPALEPVPKEDTAKESATPPAPAPQPAPKTKPKTQAKAQDPLQLSMPDFALPSGGLGAAVSRPPGITRSGENDDFARGVIRALRQTMPPPRGMFGRVTVRLLLNENGNLVEVALLKGADDPILTQSVVFAVRQASFPFPPAGANLADRTFMVTYVYR
jgi:periplasmic protein TonB